jgi:hypothetical protein
LRKEDGTRKKEEEQKKENRTECDSNELTIYNEEKKKLMIDHIYIYACSLSHSLFFLNTLKKKKNDNILIST